MKIISHRGYLNGANLTQENNPQYIDKCIELNFEVEIDLRIVSNKLYLGHDYGKHRININWLSERKDYLWIHCKSFDTLRYLKATNFNYNYFWHENDTFTITSHGIIWAYPSKEIYEDAVNVLPEINIKTNDILNQKKIFAVCTDYPENYKS